MWELQLAGISFFDVFYNFFIYSFFGWLYESTYVSIREKKWVNRGFLNGPIIPIYGATATLLYIAFFNNRVRPLTESKSIAAVVIIYFSGLLLASLLEFVTSYVMERLFHAKWWDYSECFMNIQGRVCLKASLFWGLLSVVMAEAIQPAMERVLHRLKRPASEYAGYVIFIVFLADLVVTVRATLRLTPTLARMEKLRTELYELLEEKKWDELKDDLKKRLQNQRVSEYLEQKKAQREKRSEEFREKLAHIQEKYRQSVTGRAQKHVLRRLMKAYPHMKVRENIGALHDLRERLTKKNKK